MRSELRDELLRRVARDQAARTEDDREKMVAVDAENLPWLKSVVAEVGWPGRSMVGEDGAHAAWLLAQHADADPAFQRTCLDLITEAVKSGEATLVELAYLTDRVLLAEEQPACRSDRYGRTSPLLPAVTGRLNRPSSTVPSAVAASSSGCIRWARHSTSPAVHAAGQRP